MNDLTEDKLQSAYTLIKAGQNKQACKILIPLLRANPNLADGWFLLGHAVDDPQEKIHCFQKVVYLDPTNQPAQKQLDRLLSTKTGPYQAKGTGKPVNKKRNSALFWGVAGLTGLIVCLSGLGLLWSLRKSIPTDLAPTITNDVPSALPTVTLVTPILTAKPNLPPKSTSRPTITLQPTSTLQPSVTTIPTLTLTFTPTQSPAPRTGPKVPTICIAPNGLGNFTAPFKIENFGKDKSIIYLKGITQDGNHPVNCQITVRQGVPITIDLAWGNYEYIVLRGGTVRRGNFFINQPTKATMQIFADKIRFGEFP